MLAAPDLLPLIPVHEPLLIPFALGVAIYFVYKRYEINPGLYIPLTITLLVLPPAFSSLFLFYHHWSPSLSLWRAVFTSFTVFYSTILICMGGYRLSPWHPLARYPGPFLAKLSMFWLAYVTYRGKFHIVLRELHECYGPYVRIGPNQLSFIDVSLIPRIMGSDGMPKGPLFDGARIPGVPANVVATRDLEDHARQRRTWTRCLSATAVKEYQPTIVRRALQLAEELEKHAIHNQNSVEEVSTDLAGWMSRFAFDFMGSMAFGGGFELLKEGDKDGIWDLISRQMKAHATLQRLPWSSYIVHRIPYVVAAMKKFTQFCDRCVVDRRTRGPSTSPDGKDRDVFHYLINEDEGPQAYPDHLFVIENAKVAIIGGSDTTASTMSNVFFYLLTNPDVFRRLRAELDEAFPPGEGDPFDFTRLAELPYLNAVINETLRLQPPLPTDLQRAPSAGTKMKVIGDHVIPEGTGVSVPPYVLHRQKQYFSKPDEFIPERWVVNEKPSGLGMKEKKISPLSDATEVWHHNTQAYIPFSTGFANCAGRMLALAEMKSVIALVLQRFDIRFAANYNPEQWEKDIMNYFVYKLGELPVVLTPRM